MLGVDHQLQSRDSKNSPSRGMPEHAALPAPGLGQLPPDYLAGLPHTRGPYDFAFHWPPGPGVEAMLPGGRYPPASWSGASPTGLTTLDPGQIHAGDFHGRDHGDHGGELYPDAGGRGPAGRTRGQVKDTKETTMQYAASPVSPPPQRERFSYTPYQVELLNAIYEKIRYPNSMQKQLVAKRVGITRDQVKIWFQNRRRRDVVGRSGGKGRPDPGEKTRTSARMVPATVLQSILLELLQYETDPKGKKAKESLIRAHDAKKKKAYGVRQRAMREAGVKEEEEGDGEDEAEGEEEREGAGGRGKGGGSSVSSSPPAGGAPGSSPGLGQGDVYQPNGTAFGVDHRVGHHHPHGQYAHYPQHAGYPGYGFHGTGSSAPPLPPLPPTSAYYSLPSTALTSSVMSFGQFMTSTVGPSPPVCVSGVVASQTPPSAAVTPDSEVYFSDNSQQGLPHPDKDVGRPLDHSAGDSGSGSLQDLSMKMCPVGPSRPHQYGDTALQNASGSPYGSSSGSRPVNPSQYDSDSQQSVPLSSSFSSERSEITGIVGGNMDHDRRLSGISSHSNPNIDSERRLSGISAHGNPNNDSDRRLSGISENGQPNALRRLSHGNLAYDAERRLSGLGGHDNDPERRLSGISERGTRDPDRRRSGLSGHEEFSRRLSVGGCAVGYRSDPERRLSGVSSVGHDSPDRCPSGVSATYGHNNNNNTSLEAERRLSGVGSGGALCRDSPNRRLGSLSESDAESPDMALTEAGSSRGSSCDHHIRDPHTQARQSCATLLSGAHSQAAQQIEMAAPPNVTLPKPPGMESGYSAPSTPSAASDDGDHEESENSPAAERDMAKGSYRNASPVERDSDVIPPNKVAPPSAPIKYHPPAVKPDLTRPLSVVIPGGKAHSSKGPLGGQTTNTADLLTAQMPQARFMMPPAAGGGGGGGMGGAMGGPQWPSHWGANGPRLDGTFPGIDLPPGLLEGAYLQGGDHGGAKAHDPQHTTAESLAATSSLNNFHMTTASSGEYPPNSHYFPDISKMAAAAAAHFPSFEHYPGAGMAGMRYPASAPVPGSYQPWGPGATYPPTPYFPFPAHTSNFTSRGYSQQ